MADEDILWDFPLSNTLEGRILEATVNRLKALNLPCIEASNIVLRKLAWISVDGELKTPCVIVSPAPETTNWQEGTNERDRPQFAAFITIILASNRAELVRGMGIQAFWRQEIREAFQNLSMSRFTELTLDQTKNQSFNKANVESGDKYLEAAKRDQRDAQYFLVRFTASEGRRQ